MKATLSRQCIVALDVLDGLASSCTREVFLVDVAPERTQPPANAAVAIDQKVRGLRDFEPDTTTMALATNHDGQAFGEQSATFFQSLVDQFFQMGIKLPVLRPQFPEARMVTKRRDIHLDVFNVLIF